MQAKTRKKAARPPAPADDATPRYRSGAVARMIQMPVATLRVWERRYRVTQAAVSPSGHRLYSAADVRRLAQLKQLADTGHAIGSIASLSDDQLRQVAATHATSLARRRAEPAVREQPWSVVIVGQALARRLHRPTLTQRVGRALRVVAIHETLAQVSTPDGTAVDALLFQTPRIDADTLAQLQAAFAASGARRGAVLYGFGATPLCDAIAAAGFAVLRESQDDRALAVWLRGLADATASASREPSWTDPLAAAEPVPPRRYDDAALTDFAGLSSTIACECPRHVAELVMQLSHFEAYSAECAHRSPADASLHTYLRQVAGRARVMFETALERVAIQEGLMLPP